MAERNSPVMDVMIAASMSRVAFLCLLAGGCAIAFAPILARLADTGRSPAPATALRACRARTVGVHCRSREGGNAT